jgi:hypothetical protein
MACSSDTESDSDTVTSRPAFHAIPNSDVRVPSFEAVRSAVETLSERDIPSILEVPQIFQVSHLLELLNHIFFYRIDLISKNHPNYCFTSWIVYRNF